MKNLTATLLVLAVLLFNAGEGWSADFKRGVDAYKNKDYATALRELKPLAKNKGALSLFYSKEDVIIAQYNLGVMYDKGQGVPQDNKTAVKWYRLAAEQGNAYAQGNLGVMYASGQGVLKDYVYAHMWGNIAVSIGGKDKGKVRDFVEKKMTPADISAAKKLARECVRKKFKGC